VPARRGASRIDGGQLHEWRQRFWARRYRAIVVADEAAAVDRLRYILRHGCKEGLVDRPRDWPGASCVRALIGGGKLSGIWHDRAAEYCARRRGERVASGQFASVYRVHLSPLPCWADMSPARHRAACADLVASIEAATRAERAQSGKSCIGREAILAQHPHDGPASSNTSPAPLVHASSKQVRMAFRQAYAAFVDAFRAAAAFLRRGKKADFPVGAFPPGAPFIAVAPA